MNRRFERICYVFAGFCYVKWWPICERLTKRFVIINYNILNEGCRARYNLISFALTLDFLVTNQRNPIKFHLYAIAPNNGHHPQSTHSTRPQQLE